MLNNVIELLFVLLFSFYSLLLGIYGLLGNVVTLTKKNKKKKQTKWGGCDNIVIA